MKKIYLVAMLLCTGGSLVAQQKGDVSVGANVAFRPQEATSASVLRLAMGSQIVSVWMQA